MATNYLFGSPTFSGFEKLYNAHADQGIAFGVLAVPGSWTTMSPVLKKFIGLPTIGELFSGQNIDDFEYFVGHVQSEIALANDVDPDIEINTDIVSPFICGEWLAAQIGMVNNIQEIKSDYSEISTNLCRGSVVPALLNKYQYKRKLQVDDVSKALSLIEGDNSYFIYNISNSKMYLIYHGVSLYFNPEDSSFASLRMDGMIPLQRAVIYERIPNVSNNNKSWSQKGKVKLHARTVRRIYTIRGGKNVDSAFQTTTFLKDRV